MSYSSDGSSSGSSSASVASSIPESHNKKERKSEISRKYRKWLGMQSCTRYRSTSGYIDKKVQTKVDFMFDKKIKFFIFTYNFEAFLVTEDGETHYWCDSGQEEDEEDKYTVYCINYYSHMINLSNTHIIKTATNYCNFITLNDDGKIYYYKSIRDKNSERMIQIDFKEKITGIACGCNYYVMVTDNGKVYTWGKRNFDSLNVSTEKKFLWENYITDPHELVELSDSTIVKVVCGTWHTFALTDKGEVYGWGSNDYKQLDFRHRNSFLSPTMINIPNIRKVSDITAMDDMSAAKSENGRVYIWGDCFKLEINKPIVCDYTNIFDVCNALCGQSPISVDCAYTDEETYILNDLEAAFNDRSTSDFTIEIEDQSIYVHKAILKIRSSYFRGMLQSYWIENNQSVIKPYHHYSYIIYTAFLKYFYIGEIHLTSLKNKLDLLKLANEYCEESLKKDCIRIIKKEITISNILFIYKLAIKYYIMELEEYCFNLSIKNMTNIVLMRNFKHLDDKTIIKFMTAAAKAGVCQT